MTKRPYVVFPNGAPFPGTCVGCRSGIELHDLGADLLSGGNAMLCKQCVMDLAIFNGWAPEAPLQAEIEELKAQLASKEAVIKNIPNNIEGLINGIRNSVSDFVLTISGGSDNGSSLPVQEPEVSDSGASKPRKAKSVNS
jgi:hypothetical protein